LPSSDPLAPWLRLILTPGVGPGQQRQLLAAFGPPEGIYAAGHSAIAAVIGGPAARTLLDHDATPAVEVALEWLSQPGNRLLTLGDEAYPAALLEIPDPPVALYVKGDAALLSRPSLAVVGARNATPQGEANAESFSRALSEAGLCIVSGLALGIDAAAHRGGLAGPGSRWPSSAPAPTASTRRATPRWPGRSPRPGDRQRVSPRHRPAGPQLPAPQPPHRRAGPGRAGGRGGAEERLADHRAAGHRLRARGFRDPGSIHSPVARGCHQLIRDGAKLVETAVDILDELRSRPRSRAA
jgi:DNA processing protein